MKLPPGATFLMSNHCPKTQAVARPRGRAPRGYFASSWAQTARDLRGTSEAQA